MFSSNKWRRNLQKYYAFLISCFCSFLGLLFYLFGKNYLSFPSRWLTDNPQVKLFSFGISIHSSVNFFLQTLFSLLTSEKKLDYLKIREWKYWIQKILVLVSSVILILFFHKDYLIDGNQVKWKSVFFLGLIGAVINCCLIDLLIQLMNQYGICNAFNLIFFTDCLPIEWIKRRSGNYLEFLGLFLITIFFIWITNLKWEVPVETNSLYNQDNSLTKETASHLGFKLNFSFIPFYYLSWLLSLIYSLKILWKEIDWSKGIKEVIWEVGKIDEKKVRLVTEGEVVNQSWGEILLIMNEEKNFFNINRWKKILVSGKKWKMLGAASFLFFLRWLVNWFQVSQMQWKSSEISEDLREKGVYLDGISYGRATQKLIKRVVNKLIIFWFFLIILPFNLVFDCFVSSSNLPLNFISWFSSINVGTSLIQQIRTKYKYVQANQ